VQLDYSTEDREFAEMIRRFVRANLDPITRQKELHGKLPTRQERTVWQRTLAGAGWGAPSWPVEYGGPGWSAVQRHLFDEVLSEEGAPSAPVFGMGMLAPVIMRFGSAAQKSRFLSRMVTLEDWWCQGFSEPGAGSDLASLRTRAVLDGDNWLINGQKIWTTLAHWADWMFCLVRTSDEPKKQLGISMVLIDMKSPGISVRPIITIDGEHEVNEVFLTDVRIPATNVVGQVGSGWDYAKYLLSHERTGIARVGHSRRQILRLKRMAANEPTPTGVLIDDPAFRLKVARLEIRLKALELTSLRMLANQQSGVPPGSEAHLLKIKGTEIQQDIAELMMDAAGRYAFAYDPQAWSDGAHRNPIGPDYAATLAGVYFNTRKVSIYGGSNEIQRNLLAKLALGL
jgi:alkylation response protein AidB-like acyl-CoA dehydrogenase